VFRGGEDHLVADETLRQIRLQIICTGHTIREVINRLEIDSMSPAADDAAETAFVILSSAALDRIVLINKFSAFRAAIPKTRLVAGGMENEFAPSNAVVSLNLLVTQAAPKTARMPHQPGKFDIIILKRLLAAGTCPGSRGVVMRQITWNCPLNNLKFVREWKTS
jgi:hypothetical protein